MGEERTMISVSGTSCIKSHRCMETVSMLQFRAFDFRCIILFVDFRKAYVFLDWGSSSKTQLRAQRPTVSQSASAITLTSSNSSVEAVSAQQRSVDALVLDPHDGRLAYGFKCHFPGCTVPPFQTQYLLEYASFSPRS